MNDEEEFNGIEGKACKCGNPAQHCWTKGSLGYHVYECCKCNVANGGSAYTGHYDCMETLRELHPERYKKTVEAEEKIIEHLIFKNL